VRIDRASGTVVEKTNRTYQEIPKDVKFTGTLEVVLEDGLRNWTLGTARTMARDEEGNPGTPDKWLEEKPRESSAFLKEFVLDRLASIRVIGGYKSKGFGGIAIRLTQLG
jgi:CRISPR/Cas system CMR subunit Cmr4 (Cas7 group RAMP superfamily)